MNAQSLFRLSRYLLIGLLFFTCISCGDDDTTTNSPDEPFESTVSIATSSASVTEGGASASFTLSLDKVNSSGKALSIPYILSGTATNGSDYVQLSGIANIANGQQSILITIEIIDDNIKEEDEIIVVSMGSGLPMGITAGSSTSATLILKDNDNSDGGANIEVSIIGMSSVDEDAKGTGFKITFSAKNTTGAGVNVAFSMSGTATAGEDYQTIGKTAVIPNGESEAMVNIPLIDDEQKESDETIIITLVDTDLPSGFVLGTSNTLNITIKDDDNDGGTCADDNSVDQDNQGCPMTPSVSNTYSETISGDIRTITTNSYPTHDFNNQMKDTDISTTTKVFTMDKTPSKAGTLTSILTGNGRPKWKFGVAKNGVPIDPAPAEPFVFTDDMGEYNWDWVFEPNNNMEQVGLDCAIAHVQPDGTYHYHGDMAIYADQLSSGLGSGSAVPTSAVQIGWAADGYPIVYKYGPDASGNIKKLSSGYQLKSGERPGDGIDEPCGEYNGKYTNDYEFSATAGDLDECNGIARNITLDGETFDYFYVITEAFPIISRCMVGTPDNSFQLGPG